MPRRNDLTELIEREDTQSAEPANVGRSTVRLGRAGSLGPMASKIARSLGLSGPVKRIARMLGLDMASAAQLQMRRNLTQLQAMEGVLNRTGFSLQYFESILDFSCGPARLTQYLPRLSPRAQLFGSEIDEGLIKQAQKTCPTGEFKISGLQPPLDYRDGKFDFIFSYSVFTSLSESGHQVWLKELSRLLRPGGVMLHTTHSYENIRRVAMFYPDILGQFQLPEPVDEFIKANRGYYYVPYGPDSPEYGLAVISTEYVAEKWPGYTGLNLVEHAVSAMEGYPSGPQDFVVLTKPKGA